MDINRYWNETKIIKKTDNDSPNYDSWLSNIHLKLFHKSQSARLSLKGRFNRVNMRSYVDTENIIIC